MIARQSNHCDQEGRPQGRYLFVARSFDALASALDVKPAGTRADEIAIADTVVRRGPSVAVCAAHIAIAALGRIMV